MLNITQLLSSLYPWKGWIVMSLSSIVSVQVDQSANATFDNHFALTNIGQNFTVQLETDGLISVFPKTKSPLFLPKYWVNLGFF